MDSQITSRTDPTEKFGVEIRKDHFSFAQGYRPLNHGSFGAFPRTVAEYQRQLQLESEARPDTFIRYTYPKLLQTARSAIAPLLGADVNEVVFIPNATTGINTVLRNVDFKDGDVVIHFNTIYGACLKTLQSLAEGAGIHLRSVDLTYPVGDDVILEKFEEMVHSVQSRGQPIKMAVFDTVLTFPGVRFPWEALVMSCKKFGILSFVDGAHGIGHIDLSHLGSSSLKPDFMISNCYKWLMVPRGCAILYVPTANHRLIRTTFPTSWGYEKPDTRELMDPSDYFVRLFVKVSTTDTTPFVCVPVALKWRQEVCGGEARIREYCESIAREGGRRMAKLLGTEVLGECSDSMQRCCFTNVRLPLSIAQLGVQEVDGARIAKWIQEETPDKYETYIPTKFYAGAFWSRISGQVYLTLDDFDFAAQTLLELCRRAEAGEWKTE
ncbi:hypothetical protein KVR01_010764 [Diaporthe batatas]|uniref:uncharacterized protein n=1 Tax=Diaporthe batatas TaxID=748121 RepID=UPI001D03A52F|nr:uncharacterized protein KVR01_010764 [Diaporthe batatas]KAG8159103.1 hypothetical protein KVR01_010764 [Diaporthe batatas]